MKGILFIGTLLMAISCKGQTFIDTAILVLKKQHVMSNVLRDESFSGNKIFTGTNSFDAGEFSLIIFSDTYNESGQAGRVQNKNPDFNFWILTIDDTIFMSKISRTVYVKDTTTPTVTIESPDPAVDSLTLFNYTSTSTNIFTFIDTGRLLRYIAKHNFKYRSVYKLDDFIHQDLEFGQFGFSCGQHALFLTDEAYKLAKLVKDKNVSRLTQLASSFSSADRANGCAGLYFLSLKGQVLSGHAKYLLKTNKNSNARVFFCEDCLFGDQPLSEALDDAKLKQYFNILRINKLL